MTARSVAHGIVRAVLILVVAPLAASAQDRVDSTPSTPPPDAPIPLTPVPSPPEAVPIPDPGPAAPPSPFDDGRSGGGFGGGFGRDFRPSLLRADYRVTWFPDEPIHGQNANLGMVREDLSLALPVWHDGTNDFAATAHVRNEIIHTTAILPDTGQPFPQELWDIRFGGSYRHLFDNGWIGGASFGLGTSGDQPFEHTRDFTASLNAFLTVPQGERNYWLFSLAYSSNSELPFPVPGVAYVWQPSDQFRAQIGLPFQLMYRPVDDLTLDVSYMLLYTFRARATYRVLPQMRVYVGYEVADEGYPLADRPDPNDRLFYYDQRVVAGTQLRVGHNATLDLMGGYAFDRYYFEGQHFSDHSSTNTIDVGNGAFISVNFQTRW